MAPIKVRTQSNEIWVALPFPRGPPFPRKSAIYLKALTKVRPIPAVLPFPPTGLFLLLFQSCFKAVQSHLLQEGFLIPSG